MNQGVVEKVSFISKEEGSEAVLNLSLPFGARMSLIFAFLVSSAREAFGRDHSSSLSFGKLPRQSPRMTFFAPYPKCIRYPHTFNASSNAAGEGCSGARR